MPNNGVNPLRDEDRSPLEDDLLPALVDEDEADNHEGGTDQLTVCEHVTDELGLDGIAHARQEVNGERKAVHLGKQGNHEGDVGAVGLPLILGTHRRKEHEECDKEDIEKCDEPKVSR